MECFNSGTMTVYVVPLVVILVIMECFNSDYLGVHSS